jgi:uncharacterized membrane protein
MNTPSDHNPYAPPKANVSGSTGATATSNGVFVEGGQSVAMSNVFEWVSASWGLFKQSPGIWILIFIIMIALSMVLGFIPVLGSLANSIITPVFIGGLMIGCKALEDGEPLEVGHLFAGFKEKFGPLAIIGLLQLAAVVGMVIVFGVLIVAIFGVGLFQNIGDTDAMANFFATQGLKLVGGLIFALILVSIPFAMAFWFAPVLVVFHNLSPTSAIANSFKGCLRNFLQLFVCAIIFSVLIVLGCIPILLGLLAVLPMIYCCIYASYKDIYLQ